MSTKIILKKSSTAGAVPLTGDLDLGELAINVVDRKVYTKDNSGAVIKVNGAYVDSVAPSVPAEGDLWYDTTNNLLKAYNGSSWEVSGYTSLTQFGVTATASELNTLDGITATVTELNYTDGVTSNIQNQLDGKSSTAHSHTLDSLTNVVIQSNTAGEILAWSGSSWRNYTLAEAGIQPAGSYLTAEADTLDTVTGRGASTTNAITVGGLTINGDLTVTGNTTTVNSNEVNIGDAVILLNADETGTPSQNAGFEVERGTSANVAFLWVEADDAWDMGNYNLQNVVINGGTY